MSEPKESRKPSPLPKSRPLVRRRVATVATLASLGLLACGTDSAPQQTPQATPQAPPPQASPQAPPPQAAPQAPPDASLDAADDATDAAPDARDAGPG
jgi:hypothetical protein